MVLCFEILLEVVYYPIKIVPVTLTLFSENISICVPYEYLMWSYLYALVRIVVSYIFKDQVSGL